MAEYKPTGIQLITDERKRQVYEKGYNADHDLEHENGELAWAATAYAAPERIFRMNAEYPFPDRITFSDPFPIIWDPEHDKRRQHPRIRQLAIAGALIAAEIDRIIAANKLLEKSDG